MMQVGLLQLFFTRRILALDIFPLTAIPAILLDLFSELLVLFLRPRRDNGFLAY